MRLIPGKTKIKMELFRGITIGGAIDIAISVGLAALVVLSTFPGRIYVTIGILVTGGFLLLRIDDQPFYAVLLGIVRFMAYPRRFRRTAQVAVSAPEQEAAADGEESLTDKIGRIKDGKEKTASGKKEKKTTGTKTTPMDELIPFTGISEGFVEYGSYYGAVIEVDPVEFRFFSQYRWKMVIEECMGKILRSLRDNYAANIIKIERPIIYDSYLEKEYDKLDDLRLSYEKGFLNEEELKARVEIQYDRIRAMQDLCGEHMIIQPFYYIVLFHSDKRQLLGDVNMALASLRQGELAVRRLETDKSLALFLKYTNTLDFDEKEIDRIDPKDYVAWASPETVSFTRHTAEIDQIVTHQMRVVNYPSAVGDAWIAGVMSIPSTKVVVKVSTMDRVKSIKVIDRSLQELRGRYNETSIDSKRLELQTHIETLSELLVTLQQENENLLMVNIYISMYDSIRTTEMGRGKAVKNTRLAAIGDMKKTIRRSWHETGMRLNGMDFEQLHCFIGSQVSAYDPMLKYGRGMPSNTVAAMFPWIYASVSDEGGIRLGSHEGVPVFINFFRRDSERVNSNMVIIGKSGSGKSYGTKSILTNMASEDAKIFILDPENEYTELAQNLHGKVINVGNANYGRLNPFHIITSLDDDEAGGESAGGSFATHLQFLEEFFRQILPDTDREALEYLNTLVERLYADHNITQETDLSKLTPYDYPVFDDLYDLVLEEFQRTTNEYLRSMLHTLMNNVAKFAKGGRNANIWNGPSTITTEENFSVFNFQSLLANRNTTIANAQMLLVLKYVDNEIIKNRDYNRKYGLHRKVVVVIDEAHVFIDTKFPVALDFMFQLAKRIRKYNGMQIVITQNIKDFVGSEEIARKSTAIINACQYSFIFGLAPNDMDDLCKLYEKAGGINQMEQEQIVTAPRGQTFAIMSPTSRSSFMVEVPRPMVQMFEEPDFVSRYFTGENGTEYWERFVAGSREAHQFNVSERRRSDVQEDRPVTPKKKPTITLTEISEVDAMDLATPGNTNAQHITLEEYLMQSQSQPAAPEPEAPAAPQMDMEEMLRRMRAEVEREVSRKMQNALPPQQMPGGYAQGMPMQQMPSGYEDEKTEEPVYSEEESSGAILGSIFDSEESGAEDFSEDNYEDAYEDDIVSFLDDQTDSFSEMTLRDRMELIKADVINITFEDLETHVKSNRKKRS